MMKNSRVILPALLIVFLFGFAGCYTILKHPVDGDSGHQYSQRYYQQNCLDCHPDYHEYPYGYYYSYYPSYYFDYPRWGRYYAYPWWWDHYWYSDGGNQEYYDETGDAHDKLSRERGPGGMAPPYSGGGSSTFHRGGGGVVNTKPADSGGETAGSETKQPSGPTAVQKDDSGSRSGATGDTDNSKDDQKKDESKDSSGKKPRKR